VTGLEHVVSAPGIAPVAAPGDTVAVRDGQGPATGCETFVQQVLACQPGTSAPRETGEAEEVLFVLGGEGAVLAGGERHPIGPGSGVALAPGTAYRVENPGPAPLELVAVAIPSPAPGGVEGVAVIDPADQESGVATADRSFRLVAHPATGCASATQFVGFIPPGRAPDHYHHYDEVIYLLHGSGTMHLPHGTFPLSEGSCIHLPARLIHSLENAGEDPMEVLGVFRPAGSPSEAYYPDGTPAMTPEGGTTR
jgi:mannose-6-phosphate isomerase-like protein (cupin superfamily)